MYLVSTGLSDVSGWRIMSEGGYENRMGLWRGSREAKGEEADSMDW